MLITAALLIGDLIVFGVRMIMGSLFMKGHTKELGNSLDLLSYLTYIQYYNQQYLNIYASYFCYVQFFV